MTPTVSIHVHRSTPALDLDLTHAHMSHVRGIDDSPAPHAMECVARICSTRVLPDRGKPTTNTGVSSA